MLILDKLSDGAQYWRHWNHYAEEALLAAAGLGPEFKGRGELAAHARNTPSAPQDPASGCAITKAHRLLRDRLSAMDRINMYENKGGKNSEQRRELQTLLRKYQRATPRSELEAQYAAVTTQVTHMRATSWTKWCQEQWANSPGRVYKYNKNSTHSTSLQMLQHGLGQPPSYPAPQAGHSGAGMELLLVQRRSQHPRPGW